MEYGGIVGEGDNFIVTCQQMEQRPVAVEACMGGNGRGGWANNK
jgi:hypothetical protein